MHIYRIAKKKEYLTPEERDQVKARFDDIQCSFAKDDDGYYCYTHRARSKSYPSISDIPKSKVDFINSTSAVNNTLIKTAVADGEFRDLKDRVNTLKTDIRDIHKDHKDFESRIKKLEKAIDDLNVGKRIFTENQTAFNSIQRKMERLDNLIFEWKQFKKDMTEDVKKQVEQKTKARISDLSPAKQG